MAGEAPSLTHWTAKEFPIPCFQGTSVMYVYKNDLVDGDLYGEGNIGILNCPFFFFLHFIYVRSFFILLSLTFFIISFRYVWICMTHVCFCVLRKVESTQLDSESQ